MATSRRAEANSGTPFKLFWVSYFPFYTAFYLCKAALLTFYEPLFPIFMRKRRAVLWSVCAYTAMSFVVSIVLNLALCDPVWGNWALDPTGMCEGDSGVIVFHVSWSLHFSSDIVRTSFSHLAPLYSRPAPDAGS